MIPSGTGGLLCLFAGITTVGVGVLQSAAKQGTAVVRFNTGSTGSVPIIKSLDRLLSRGSWVDILILVILTLTMLVVFGLIEFLFGSFASLQAAREKGAYVGSAIKADTSEQQWLLQRGYFRLIVGLIAIVLATLLIHLIHWASSAERAQITFLQLSLTSAA